jgi:hypothetical protein
MPPKKPHLKALWHALDEAQFGTERTLNLRESLPSAADARARAEVWLRGRQVTRPEEVLIITGRGNQSIGGVGVIRQEILEMMPSLRRRGIVESWREHSPGSIVVKLAQVNALLSAGKRRRDSNAGNVQLRTELLAGLDPETLRLLRDLAAQSLSLLGIEETEEMVQAEMTRTFSTLISALPPSADREGLLRASIRNAIDEGSDEK